ncbi:MAG: plasmid mobilization protein [Variovorax sp.]|nr:MAG: plasmid mobilization protein [Variovorax sp.]
MASFHHHLKSGKKGSGALHVKYITRAGKFSSRTDLIDSGHGNMPDWAKGDPQLFWRAADKYERANGAVYREHEIALPAELTVVQQLELVKDLTRELIGNKPYQYAVHAPVSSLQGVTNAHLHLTFSDRLPDGIARSPEQTFRRYNAKQPELGGAKKDSGGKNSLELRDELIGIRGKCAEVQNAALARHGHAARVDHRPLRLQGVERQPERHLGPARIRNMDTQTKDRYLGNREHGDAALTQRR